MNPISFSDTTLPTRISPSETPEIESVITKIKRIIHEVFTNMNYLVRDQIVSLLPKPIANRFAPQISFVQSILKLPQNLRLETLQALRTLFPDSNLDLLNTDLLDKATTQSHRIELMKGWVSQQTDLSHYFAFLDNTKHLTNDTLKEITLLTMELSGENQDIKSRLSCLKFILLLPATEERKSIVRYVIQLMEHSTDGKSQDFIERIPVIILLVQHIPQILRKSMIQKVIESNPQKPFCFTHIFHIQQMIEMSRIRQSDK